MGIYIVRLLPAHADASLTFRLRQPSPPSACPRRHAQQGLGVGLRAPQPAVNVLHLNGNHVALVLLVVGQLRVGFVHPGHERVTVGVDRQQRVAVVHFARGFVPPGVPQTGQAQSMPSRRRKGPPDPAREAGTQVKSKTASPECHYGTTQRKGG